MQNKLLNKGKGKLAHLFGVNLHIVWNIDRQDKPENWALGTFGRSGPFPMLYGYLKLAC